MTGAAILIGITTSPRVEFSKVRSPVLKKLRAKRIVAKQALIAVSLASVIAAGSVGLLVVYDSLQSTRKVESAPIDLRALASDPGPVYDRTPVTPSPSPVSTPSPAPAPQPGSQGYVRTPYVPPAEEPYRLVIDSIGVDAPVVAEYTDVFGVPQVPHSGYQVAWYVSTAAPGTGDNAVFAAHVTWNGVAVFYNLHSIQIGAQIRLDGDDGSTLVYTVTDSFLVNPDDPNSIQVMRSTGYDSITLISCDGAFFNDGSYGDYTNRRVVRGALTEKIMPSGAQPANGP